MDPKDLLTQKEAAEYLGLSQPTFRKLFNSGAIPFYWLGDRRRFAVEDLNAAYKREEAR